MSLLVAILTLLLLALVLAIIGAPLRAASRREREGVDAYDPAPEGAPGRPGDPNGADAPDAADLQAAREAKYREIRDAELDYRTGKLSQEDYEAIDAELRAEALAILDRIAAVSGPDAPAAEGGPPESGERPESPRSGPGVLEQQDRVQEE